MMMIVTTSAAIRTSLEYISTLRVLIIITLDYFCFKESRTILPQRYKTKVTIVARSYVHVASMNIAWRDLKRKLPPIPPQKTRGENVSLVTIIL